AWRKGRAAWDRPPEQRAAASGAWTAADTVTARVCFTDTPFVVTLRLKFTGDGVRRDAEMSVGIGPTRDALIVGQAHCARPRPAPGATTRDVRSLIERLKGGDQAVRNELIERAAERIRALAHSMLRSRADGQRVRRAADTDDLSQETVLRLMEVLRAARVEVES